MDQERNGEFGALLCGLRGKLKTVCDFVFLFDQATTKGKKKKQTEWVEKYTEHMFNGVSQVAE